MKAGPVRSFMDKNFRHFNAAATVDAARDFEKLIDSGGKMFLSMAGAMSTGELGITLAEMIRQEKIHGISCTGANLEEDVFNLVAHQHYKRIPKYRNLSLAEEKNLFRKHLNRVTDVAIPEKPAMTPVEDRIIKLWQEADEKGKPQFPHEFLYEILLSGELEEFYEIDPKNSWMLAAAEADLPIFVPGWEDSTLGNVFAATCASGEVKDVHAVRSGVEYMLELMTWYRRASRKAKFGFFQIGGGIAGDFSICVVPVLRQDADPHVDVPLWAYFCQISDAVTSYGGYSGATPNEKITWGKLEPETPAHVIESDASIVAPMIFAYVLNL